MTADSRLARIAIGETGFERAAVWSAVGFAVSYVAFDAVALLATAVGVTPVASGVIAPVAAVLAALTAVGAVAFSAVGAGVLPAVLLAYGPFAAVLLRTVGPVPYTIPFSDPLPFAIAVAEPLAVALAAAVAVGVAGYLVGRAIAGIGEGGAENDADGEPSPGADDGANASD
jgi:hypothetical protein